MTELAIQIRRGEPADAPALSELAARIFRETFESSNTPEDLAAFINSAYGVRQQTGELRDPDVITLLAEGPAGLAAYAQVRRNPPPECVTGEEPIELLRFYVDRPFQGQGLSQRLMEAVHAAARELGGRTLWLGVWEHNERAKAFYRKCGLREVGEHDFWVGSDRQIDRIMVTEVRAG
ncbi:MAG TPA: GNAT family N-acetyltransferase [Thermoanaerobaculia bacterium]|nr:GNAT family N-acetyltransferase [Thermoanaerobaculia bacterium]